MMQCEHREPDTHILYSVNTEQSDAQRVRVPGTALQYAGSKCYSSTGTVVQYITVVRSTVELTCSGVVCTRVVASSRDGLSAARRPLVHLGELL
jgi:hypothetical protein